MKSDKINPCKSDCPDRRVGCHAECEKYKAYRADREKLYKKRMTDKDITTYLVESKKRCEKKKPLVYTYHQK